MLGKSKSAWERNSVREGTVTEKEQCLGGNSVREGTILKKKRCLGRNNARGRNDTREGILLGKRTVLGKRAVLEEEQYSGGNSIREGTMLGNREGTVLGRGTRAFEYKAAWEDCSCVWTRQYLGKSDGVWRRMVFGGGWSSAKP